MKKLCLIDKEKLLNEIVQLACTTAYCNTATEESNRNFYKKCMKQDMNKILGTLKIKSELYTFNFSDELIQNNK